MRPRARAPAGIPARRDPGPAARGPHAQRTGRARPTPAGRAGVPPRPRLPPPAPQDREPGRNPAQSRARGSREARLRAGSGWGSWWGREWPGGAARPSRSGAKPRRGTTARGAEGLGPRRPDGADTHPPGRARGPARRPVPGLDPTSPLTSRRLRRPRPPGPRLRGLAGDAGPGGGQRAGTRGAGGLAGGRPHLPARAPRPSAQPERDIRYIVGIPGPSRDRRVSATPPSSPRRWRRPRLDPAPLRPRPHSQPRPVPHSGGPASQPARSRPQPTRPRPRRPRLPRLRLRTIREGPPAPPRPPAQLPGVSQIQAPAPRPAPHLDAGLSPHLRSARAGPLLASCAGKGPSLALSSTTETELNKTNRL